MVNDIRDLRPFETGERIELGHGAGTRMTEELLEHVIFPAFDNPVLRARGDSACLECATSSLAFTTDAYVVKPWQFPGGNIGDLAVCGAVNDLAMAGARPVALSIALVIEEGFPRQALVHVIETIAGRARQAGAPIVTGDTKVVERGHAEGLYIVSSGVGERYWHECLPAREGDVVLLSGDVGRHALAIHSIRQGFQSQPPVLSDVDCLHGIVGEWAAHGWVPVFMRDLTRGGLGMALADAARQLGHAIDIVTHRLPLIAGVESGVEAMGLDPWFLANEGRFIAILRPEHAAMALTRLQDINPMACLLGHLVPGPPRVRIPTGYGPKRYLRIPASDPLPRIC